jgi:hypothetical protein
MKITEHNPITAINLPIAASELEDWINDLKAGC